MTHPHMHPENCGPAIACGASAVTLTGKQEGGAGFGALVDSVKRFARGARGLRGSRGHAPLA